MLPGNLHIFRARFSRPVRNQQPFVVFTQSVRGHVHQLDAVNVLRGHKIAVIRNNGDGAILTNRHG
ncbi:hypothetical protein D3C80_2009920 [compost metagenome]